MTALGAAALGGHSTVARLLLEARVQIDPVDVAGETPLFYASRDGQDDVACLLLKAGAEADKETLGGQFPLLAACRGGHFDVVRHLLEAKSVVDRTGPDLKTPLMIASRCGYTQVVWLLLEKRASKSATDIFGESAYLAACRSQKQELIQLFTGTGIHDLSCRSEPLLQLAYIQITLHAIAIALFSFRACHVEFGHFRTQGASKFYPQSYKDTPASCPQMLRHHTKP